MRTVERIELPSTRAAITWACFAIVRRFMFQVQFLKVVNPISIVSNCKRYGCQCKGTS